MTLDAARLEVERELRAYRRKKKTRVPRGPQPYQRKLREGEQRESEILTAIREWSDAQPGLMLERNSRGKFKVRGISYSFGLGGKGTADLVGGVAPHGRLVALEVKSVAGAVKPEQRAFLERVNALGGYGVVVRSLRGAQIAIAAARAGAVVEHIDPERELEKKAA